MLAGGIALAIGPSRPGHAQATAASLLVKAGRELMFGRQGLPRLRAFAAHVQPAAAACRPRNGSADPASWSRLSGRELGCRTLGYAQASGPPALAIVAVTLQPPVVRITGLPTTTTARGHDYHLDIYDDDHDYHDVPGLDLLRPRRTTSTTTYIYDHNDHDNAAAAIGLDVGPATDERVSVVLVIANTGNVAVSEIWAVRIGRGAGAHDRYGAKPRPPTTRASVAAIGRLAPGASVVVTLPR